MNTTNKPATPLPFGIAVNTDYGNATLYVRNHGRTLTPEEYVAVADRANAYPQLVAALLATVRVCERSIDFNIRHGSGVAQAAALLRSIGEAA